MFCRFAPKRWVAALSIVATLTGCVTSAALRDARRAEERQDYDIAVIEYTRALQRDPDNVDARTGLQRAKLRAAQDHITRARRLSANGRLEEAAAEYKLAAELNPDNRVIVDEMALVQNQLRAQIAINRDGRTQLEALVDRMKDQPPPGLGVPAEPLPELNFRNAPSDVVIRALAQMTNVSVFFDPAFRPQPINFEARGQTLAQALQSITASTQTFFRVTAPRAITIIPDTPAKRREYEEDVVRTFYLSNVDVKETMDLLRIVIDARRIGGMQGTNAITITDTPERVEAAGRLISIIDKARPEVLIDVELLEVSRSRLAEYGLQFASPGTPPTGINGAADVNRAGLTVNDLKNLSGSQILLSNVPALYYRLLKEDTRGRVLANPQLRAQVGTNALAQFGERVPVPVTTFSPIATGGVNQQPITSFNYENIGVNIDITPRTHMNNDVTLALAISVTSISGVGFGGLPTFGNRTVKTTIRLRDGETNMLAGLIRDDERKTHRGIPGLSDIPAVGRLFGQSRDEREQTDVILMLTPRIVRVLELTEEDLRAFQMGRDSGATGAIPIGPRIGAPAGGIDMPLPEQPQNFERPDVPPDPAQPTPGVTQPARPVLPPPAPQAPPNPGQTIPR